MRKIIYSTIQKEILLFTQHVKILLMLFVFLIFFSFLNCKFFNNFRDFSFYRFSISNEVLSYLSNTALDFISDKYNNKHVNNTIS